MEDMEDMVAVAELAEELHSLEVTYRNGFMSWGGPVEGGESYGWNHLRGHYNDGAGWTEDGLVIVRDAGWGDYNNTGTYHRANFEALQEDYPEVFVVIGYSSHDGQSLALPLAASIPESLADILRGLDDYPVYDEDRMSKIEMQIEDEAWDSWVQYDLTREIEKAYESVPGQEWETFEPVWAEADQLQLFWDAREALGVYPEFETSTSCHYRELPEMAAWILARLQSAVMV